MLTASVAMMGAGIFCVANGSVAFLSVAFVIGIVFILLGAFEILVGRRADFELSDADLGMTKDGVIMLLFGAAIVTGQITDDLSAQTVFALLLTIEGVLSFRSDWLDIMAASREQRLGMGANTLMIIIGIYMFFNNSTLNLPATMLVGICMITLGLRRVAQSFVIEYSRPSFITGNEEKLKEAEEDERRALAKAKEGIREQKSAQRRIERIKEDIAAEENIMMSAAVTRAEREAEREMEE
jgi:uncharacterized membrane protein HdeD (DUF308 family)